MPRKVKAVPMARTEGVEYNAPYEREHNIIGERIKELRTRHKLSLEEFSQVLATYGVVLGKSSINKWEVGASTPNAYQFIAVCKALGVSPPDYFTSKPELNEDGLKRLADYKADLLATGKYKPYTPVTSIRYRTMPISLLSVSAGPGEFLEDGNFESVPFPEDEIPDGAEFGIRVSGNSMEPVYHDGQVVWVQACTTIRPGEVGIFAYEGSGYLKMYSEQEPEDEEAFTDSYGAVHMQPVLISYNSDYEPIRISPDSEFRICAKVVR